MDTVDTTLLINPHRIRESIRRLFDGTPARIVSELLQNAQRAGATQVKFDTSNKNKFTYIDNGHGIVDVEGVYKLLCLGESNFSDQVESEQSPMGLGFGALLANEEVTVVRVHTGNLSLEIDCQRWWQDVDYYSSWAKRLVVVDTFVYGFSLEAVCSQKVINQLEECLPSVNLIMGYDWESHIRSYPALGYKGILDIELNNNKVNTNLPKGFIDTDLITEFLWHNAKISVYNSHESYINIQLVNWYGQLIPCKLSRHLSFLVTVSSTNPLTPKAPVRDSIVNNIAKENLKVSLIDAIFKEICKEKDITSVRTRDIYLLYKLDENRAKVECPYFLAEAYLPYERGTTADNLDETKAPEVFHYNSPPFLLDNQIEVKLPNRNKKIYSNGISSFVSCIAEVCNTPYKLEIGNSNKLRIKTLYWNPASVNTKANELTGLSWFYKRGQWLVDYYTNIPNANSDWVNLTDDAFVFTDSDCWSINEINWIIGAEADLPIEALQRFGSAGFDPNNDSYDSDVAQRDYDESMNNIVRQLMENAVSSDFAYYDYRNYILDKLNVTNKDILTFSVQFISDKGGFLCAVNLVGETIKGPFELRARIYD